MKTIRFIATALLLAWCIIGFPLLMVSCISNHDSDGQRKYREPEVVLVHKFKVGDIVYLKPDSIKAVILDLQKRNKMCGCGNSPIYRLYYFKTNGEKVVETEFKEELIY